MEKAWIILVAVVVSGFFASCTVAKQGGTPGTGWADWEEAVPMHEVAMLPALAE